MAGTARRAPDVLSAPVGDEVILLHSPTGQYFSMDEIGRAIWDRLGTEPCNLEQLCKDLQREFDVDAKTCRNDVEAFLESLHAADFIVVES